MGAKKIKISKKEILKARKAEEEAQIPVLSREWIEERSTKILTGLGVLLLLLGAVWGFNAYQASKEQRARLEYAKVLQGWPADDNATLQVWQQIIPALEAYLSEYSGTDPATNAEFDLARAYFQVQQYEKALNTTKRLLEQRTLEKSLKFLAHYQLALTYGALNRTDEALAQWQMLADSEPSGLTKEAFWNIARVYAGQGNFAKAAESCELALKAPGTYPNPVLIQTELASLKLKSHQPAGQGGSGQ